MAHDIHSHYESESHDVSRALPHHPVPFLKVFFALVVLTIVTVAIGITLRFQSEIVNVLLALLIAGMKAALVALFFMHLKFEGKLIYLIFLVPLGLCVLLVVALLPDLLSVGDHSMQMFNVPPMLEPAPHGAGH